MDVSSRIDQVLAQMRAAQAMMGTKASKAVEPAAQGVPKTDFAAVLKSSIDQVNNVQQKAQAQVNAFESGTPGVELHDVMISLSKSSIAFQQMVQVRNRLVSAYHDIMNMQV